MLHYSSFKSNRIARSALAAKRFALSHAYDGSSTVRITLNDMLDTEFPLTFYTDSKSLFDGIIGIYPPSEKLLLIDLSVIRQSYKRREFSEVFWIPADQNPADTMTKIDSKNIHLLLEIMERNKIRVQENYWVTRKK